MCGIFGYYSPYNNLASDEPLNKMALSLQHRGPDASGYFSDGYRAVGNTRLAIVDLTEQSNQPIFSDCGQVIVVQNGEIYNYLELREELILLGSKFKTSGDTEVILHSYLQYGENFIKKLNGMFSIAVLDLRIDTLWLYRDRLGVKPLYIHRDYSTDRLWFSSEIKALLAVGIKAVPNYDAISQFLALNYVPGPQTAFLGIEHLPPATIAKITKGGVEFVNYWSLDGVKQDRNLSEEDAKKQILETLIDATQLRMRSDAQYGAFLSGGLDSSSVVSAMRSVQDGEIKTYSIGFKDPRFDETKYALYASNLFSTDHTFQQMDDLSGSSWEKFIWHAEQPHGDVSFIPTEQVSRMAARDVKMVLTGDGGDELFGGYQKYADFFNQKNCFQNDTDWANRYVRNSGLLQNEEAESLLLGELSECFHGTDPYRELLKPILDSTHQDKVNRVLMAETKVLLSGNNLVKPDRMAMAHSLEVRSPFLDYRMAELAFTVPGELKVRGNTTKSILKETMLPILGEELTHRKKQMFTVPVGEWFKNELSKFSWSILLDGRFADRKLVDTVLLEKMMNNHIKGKANYTRQIRAMISLEIWFRIFIDGDHEMGLFS